MEEAKAAVGEMTLATGWMIGGQHVNLIKYRELAGPEEDILASKMSVNSKMTGVMANCTLAIGSITEPHLIRKHIQSMLITDRWIYLVALRTLSLGHEYRFGVNCPNCQKGDQVIYDLRQIKIINPPKPDSLFKEVKLPTGKTCRIRAADGDVESTIEKLSKDDNAPTVALFARVAEIGNQPADIATIKNLPLRDRQAIRKAIDELEGDIDDKVMLRCPHCQHEHEAQLELSGANFFSPSDMPQT